MKKLSIFVDESGDYGKYDLHSPFYMFSLVFHNQNDSILEEICSLDNELKYLELNTQYFHAGPIIRREDEYYTLDIKKRRKVFNKMSYFVNHINFKYALIKVEKKHLANKEALNIELSKELGKIIRNNLNYFQEYDVIKVYYDNGQKELKKILKIVLTALLGDIEFKTVKATEYRMFQVADYITTLELLEEKYLTKSLTKSEKCFFGDKHENFKKNYYRKVCNKKMS